MALKKTPKAQSSLEDLKNEKSNITFKRFKSLELDDVNKVADLLSTDGLNSNLDYHGDILIDIDNLDFEWLRQAQLVSDYGELSVYLDDLKRKLEKKITIKKAQADQEIRKNEKDNKPTEAAIKSMVEIKAEEFEEFELLEKVNYQSAMAKSALTSLDHKKKSLEWLSQLYISGYFSTPQEKRMAGKSARISEIVNNRITNSQREGLNRKNGSD